MIKWAFVGVAFVPIIIGANYVVRIRYEQIFINDVEGMVRQQLNDPAARFSDVKFPHPPHGAPIKFAPFSLCGYVNNRRFLYRRDSDTIRIESDPGPQCDPVEFPG